MDHHWSRDCSGGGNCPTTYFQGRTDDLAQGISGCETAGGICVNTVTDCSEKEGRVMSTFECPTAIPTCCMGAKSEGE